MEYTRKEIFELICSLAEEGNAQRLRYIFANNEQIDVNYSLYLFSPVVPVLQLAANRKHRAVTFLIEEFGANINAAAEGYARIGEIEKVNELLCRNADPNMILRGYAYAGDVERVEEMIAAGVGIWFATWGYAQAGNVEQVNKLIARGASALYALNGYIEYGLFAETEKILLASRKNGLQRNIDEYQWSVRHYNFFQYFSDPDKLLLLLSSTNDNTLRVKLAADAKNPLLYKGSIPDVDAILIKAKKINHIMCEYKLNFQQSQVLLQKGVLTWLLQGNQNIPRDVYMLIAQQVTGMTIQDTQEIVAAVCINTHDHAVAMIEKKYKPDMKARFFHAIGFDARYNQAEREKYIALSDLEKRYISPIRRVGRVSQN